MPHCLGLAPIRAWGISIRHSWDTAFPVESACLLQHPSWQLDQRLQPSHYTTELTLRIAPAVQVTHSFSAACAKSVTLLQPGSWRVSRFPGKDLHKPCYLMRRPYFATPAWTGSWLPRSLTEQKFKTTQLCSATNPNCSCLAISIPTNQEGISAGARGMVDTRAEFR